MKNKYFIIIFISIITATALSLTFTFYYIEKEITRSLDTQLETIASTIFASGISIEMMNNIDDVDDILSEALEEERIDRFIRIYRTGTDQLLYANEFGQVISLPPPQGKKLRTLQAGNRHFRALEISNGPFTVQVALTMDSFLFRAKALEKNLLAFTAGILLIVGLITALSLRALLRPLRMLGFDFERWSEQLSFDFTQMKQSTDQLLFRIANHQEKWQGHEISEFLKQLSKFGENLSYFLEVAQKQNSILAHELKTPLTIIRNDLSILKNQLSEPELQNTAKKAVEEIDQLSKLIRNFLQWSQQMATSSKPAEIYALSLKSVVQDEITKLQSLYPGRLQLDLAEDLQVFCAPEHLRQLIVNLTQNALVHGPSSGEVRVRLFNSILEVWDSGSGLAPQVFQNLGTPFNRGELSQGHGLGLAWCRTICDTYKWSLQFQATPAGHCVSVGFETDTLPHAVK